MWRIDRERDVVDSMMSLYNAEHKHPQLLNTPLISVKFRVLANLQAKYPPPPEKVKISHFFEFSFTGVSYRGKFFVCVRVRACVCVRGVVWCGVVWCVCVRGWVCGCGCGVWCVWCGVW